MSLPLAEKTWVILPEAPEDDGTPTGNFFASLHNVIGFGYDGEPIPGENVFESHQFNSLGVAEEFVKSSRYPQRENHNS